VFAIAEEREWLDGFLSKYVDLYRHFHPDEKDVYSVWNQKTEARIHNEGLRLEPTTSLCVAVL
jgi:exodeoxyribonuclease-3